MSLARIVQISTGLGAGNIGDELMTRAFWDHLPDGVRLEVEMFPEYTRQHEPYPPQYGYFVTDWECASTVPPGLPGVLAGGTPVADWQGLHFPLEFIARRLARFHAAGLPVDAVGVGVDRLESREAREIFERFFQPIRSWTVRGRACREALLELGVAGDRVAVGADWAWLYRPRRDLRSWAAGVWQELGIDLARPLLVANVVNEMWASRPELKSRLAAALSELSERHGFQIAFFCNEMRDGDYFDFAAAGEVRSFMTAPATVVPNQYWSPDEALGLLGHATVTFSQRYHFTVESILAGTIPVSMVRGQKMQGLLEDLDLAAAGRIDDFSAEALTEQVGAAVRNRRGVLARLQQASRRLELRALNNLAYFRSFYTG